jgi:hypothetical protein
LAISLQACPIWPAGRCQRNASCASKRFQKNCGR